MSMDRPLVLLYLLCLFNTVFTEDGVLFGQPGRFVLETSVVEANHNNDCGKAPDGKSPQHPQV